MSESPVAELAVAHTLARLLPVLPAAPAAVLEVGAGGGVLAAALARRGYAVTVMEPDPDSAAACRQRGLTVLEASVGTLAGDGRYDAVLFTRVLHHVPDPADAVRRAGAVCRPGGTVVLEDFARDEVDLAAAGFVYDAQALLAAAGLLPADESPHAGPHAAGEQAHDPVHDPEARHGVTADPLGRWRDVPPEMGTIHPGARVLAALDALPGTRTVERTEVLWRSVLSPARGEPGALRQAAEALRTIELRRIAEGTLPAIGLFAVCQLSGGA
jgi:SAM-dependent methyltransferase